MGPVDDSKNALVSQLVMAIRDVSGFPDCRNASKKMYNNLVRRVKLLSPLFEELKDSEDELGAEEIRGFESLKVALDSARELLRSINEGSKLFQALKLNKIASDFHQVTEQIEEALSQIPYNKLDISEEVREQIELVHAQFRRAKARMDTHELLLEMDLDLAQKEKDLDPAILKRLSEKLHLMTISDLKKESLAIHDMAISCDAAPGDSFQKVSFLFRKINDFVVIGNPDTDTSEVEEVSIKHQSTVIPDDFRCPISLELMKDPVIVSTGQTYERSCIQKWLDAGHKKCPKTQQTLLHTALTPNYVLKSLIALWCESNGVELPKRQGNCGSKKTGGSGSDCDRAAINALIHKLANGNPEHQRAAAGELRLLAKRNADNRVCIAEAGAIPLLVKLLSSTDSRTQEHAVTALLNLSINEANKGTIVKAGAVPDIVDVLKNGSMEGRENAAATLFSLSVLDENKGIVAPLMGFLKDAGGGMEDEALALLAILATHQEGKIAIGQTEPVPVLVEVIRTGSPRNRENAAAVLWSLCTGDVEYLKIAKELGVEETLKELSENGTDRAKRKAASVLELLQRADVVTEP
ncbi:hypothetical protein HYC85_013873 [Camellia sinensis]|uniref:RING-type E3 ubiquitin transferase n=1 Tax=Camellia sinensis TaxID=4442 RepID=A0A7J7H7Z4_CAMSI|nr:hypothetical protein HYC85_013873 [Camellia sinensis]